MAVTRKVAYSTPALDKGLDILELMASRSTGLTKSEIARELNRTVSEVFRMLVTLEHRGYISQLDDDRYSLTLKQFRLVHQYPPTQRLVTEAVPIMQALAHHTHQSCHMGVLEGPYVVILAQVNAPVSTGFYVRLGSVVDLMSASTGYVILAHQSEDTRDRILAAWRSDIGKPLPRGLLKRLDEIRHNDCEQHASFQVKGVTNMSCPIFGQGAIAIGALTVPYIERVHEPVRAETVVKLLVEAAKSISLAIGGSLPE